LLPPVLLVGDFDRTAGAELPAGTPTDPAAVAPAADERRGVGANDAGILPEVVAADENVAVGSNDNGGTVVVAKTDDEEAAGIMTESHRVDEVAPARATNDDQLNVDDTNAVVSDKKTPRDATNGAQILATKGVEFRAIADKTDAVNGASIQDDAAPMTTHRVDDAAAVSTDERLPDLSHLPAESNRDGAPLRSDLKAAPTTKDSGKTGGKASSKSEGFTAGTKLVADMSTTGANPRRSEDLGTIGATATAHRDVPGTTDEIATWTKASFTSSTGAESLGAPGTTATTAHRNVSGTADETTAWTKASYTSSTGAESLGASGTTATAHRNVPGTADEIAAWTNASFTSSTGAECLGAPGMTATTAHRNDLGTADETTAWTKASYSISTGAESLGASGTTATAHRNVPGTAGEIAAWTNASFTSSTGAECRGAPGTNATAQPNVSGTADEIAAWTKASGKCSTNRNVSVNSSKKRKSLSIVEKSYGHTADVEATAMDQVNATHQEKTGPSNDGTVDGKALEDETSGATSSSQLVNATVQFVFTRATAADKANGTAEVVTTIEPSRKSSSVPLVADVESEVVEEASSPGPKQPSTKVAPSVVGTGAVQAKVDNEVANGMYLEANGTTQVSADDSAIVKAARFRESRRFMDPAERNALSNPDERTTETKTRDMSSSDATTLDAVDENVLGLPRKVPPVQSKCGTTTSSDKVALTTTPKAAFGGGALPDHDASNAIDKSPTTTTKTPDASAEGAKTRATNAKGATDDRKPSSTVEKSTTAATKTHDAGATIKCNLDTESVTLQVDLSTGGGPPTKMTATREVLFVKGLAASGTVSAKDHKSATASGAAIHADTALAPSKDEVFIELRTTKHGATAAMIGASTSSDDPATVSCEIGGGAVVAKHVDSKVVATDAAVPITVKVSGKTDDGVVAAKQVNATPVAINTPVLNLDTASKQGISGTAAKRDEARCTSTVALVPAIDNTFVAGAAVADTDQSNATREVQSPVRVHGPCALLSNAPPQMLEASGDVDNNDAGLLDQASDANSVDGNSLASTALAIFIAQSFDAPNNVYANAAQASNASDTVQNAFTGHNRVPSVINVRLNGDQSQVHDELASSLNPEANGMGRTRGDETDRDVQNAPGLSDLVSDANHVSDNSLLPPSVIFVAQSFVAPSNVEANAAAQASNASDRVQNIATGRNDVPSIINVHVNGGQAQVDNETANSVNPEANEMGRAEDEEDVEQRAETGRANDGEGGGHELAAYRVLDKAQGIIQQAVRIVPGVGRLIQEVWRKIQEAEPTERRHIAAVASLLVWTLVVGSVVHPTWMTLLPEVFRMSYSAIEQAVLFVVTWSSVAAIMRQSFPVLSRLLMSAVVAVVDALFVGVCYILGAVISGLHKIYQLLRLSTDHVRRSMRFIVTGMVLFSLVLVIVYVAVAGIISLWLFAA
jgi:hypothetical protein